VQDSITKAELLEKVRAARAGWEALLAQIDPERSVLDGLRTGERGLQGEVDEINERVFRANRDRPLGEVLAEAREIYRDLLATIEALPEDALTAPDRFTWTGGRPVWVAIAGNTYWHYPEHAESIRAWLAGK